MTALPIKELEHMIGHQFQDRSLIQTALTHSSAGATDNYERLEFLGDRVLGLVMAGLLYARFPAETEGDLAKRLAALVQGNMLATVAMEINLGSYVVFSESEAQAGGAENENILADVFEALIGALYLDAGFEACHGLIKKLWEGRLDEMKSPPQHPKTTLQEWAQSRGLPLPVYTVVAQQGPDHAPVFEIRLSVKGHGDVTAQGRTRQTAEKEAALLFLEKLDKGGA